MPIGSNLVDTGKMEGKPKKKRWIKSAIKKPGAMTEAAKREGISNSEYIEEHKHDSGKSGQRARLAETLKGMHHGGKKHSRVKAMYGKKEGKYYGS